MRPVYGEYWPWALQPSRENAETGELNPRGSMRRSRSSIKSMSDRAFRRKLRLLKKRRRVWQAGVGSAQRLNVKRFAQSQIRDLKTIRFGRKPKPKVIGRGYRRSIVMDALYPKREAIWLPSWKRTHSTLVNLESFSFFEDPAGCLAALTQIAEAEATAADIRINFHDRFCLDVAPYMVLGLMREQMLPVVCGGQISAAVGKVLNAAHLSPLLHLGYNSTNYDDVWPFTLKIHQPRRPSYFLSPSQEEKHDSGFVKALNGWLYQLGFQLTAEGRGSLSMLIGEILDNATRHSDPVSRQGTWAMCGFMARRAYRDSEGHQRFVHLCHVAIVSLGLSLRESLNMAPNSTKADVQKYVDRHKSKTLDEDSLWSIAALQDGISRCDKSKGYIGGFGMLHFVELVDMLGATKAEPDLDKKIAIISGRSAIVMDSSSMTPSDTPLGLRSLSLNATGSLEDAPDPKYVFCLPQHFPGTIVSARFALDEALMGRRMRDKPRP